MGRMFFAAVIVGGLVLSSICLGYSGGSGTPGEPYQITTKADLLTLSDTTADYNKCFILTADIDMNGQVFTTAIIAADTSSNSGFQGTVFTGTFDGNSHKITNFTIDDGNYLGLFGYIKTGGSVKNLGLENFSVSGSSASYCVGGLVGYNHESSISHCYSTGAVNGSWGVGGLVGYDYDSSISNCHSTGVVKGFENVGGLVGYKRYGSMSHCHSTGSVSGTSGSYYVGGLVGYNYGGISDCYSTGMVIGTYDVGGLTGDNMGSISNCYSTGLVSGTSVVGGLVGGNDIYGSISNCYSTGSVSGSLDVGGLVGGNDGSISNCYSTGAVSEAGGGLVGYNNSITITNCFWDIQTSGRTTSAGGTGLNTAQMMQQGSFTGWDFATVWAICEGTNYPRLKWQILPGDFVCPDGVEMNDLAVLCEQWMLEELNSDVWPEGGDGIVNFFDWAVFANQWQITVDYESLADFAEQWLKTGARYCIADIAPAGGGDGMVNMADFAVFANNWLQQD